MTARRAGLPGWRGAYNRASTRLYGPMRGLEGFSWIDDERVAIGSIPVGDTVGRLPELGVTHLVNCRAQLQTQISQDLWAERQVLGEARVMHAPMWDNGRPQPSRLWAPAARFAAAALDADPDAGVLIHCQQGRRRSAMVAYAVLRLRGHDASEAARLVLESRAPARIVPAYRKSVEDWLAALDDPLP